MGRTPLQINKVINFLERNPNYIRKSLDELCQLTGVSRTTTWRGLNEFCKTNNIETEFQKSLCLMLNIIFYTHQMIDKRFEQVYDLTKKETELMTLLSIIIGDRYTCIHCGFRADEDNPVVPNVNLLCPNCGEDNYDFKHFDLYNNFWDDE